MRKVHINPGGNGLQIRAALKSKRAGTRLRNLLGLSAIYYTVTSFSGRSANGSVHKYFDIESKSPVTTSEFHRVQKRVNRLNGLTRFESFKTKHVAKSKPNAFVLSKDALVRILNAPKGKHTGKHTPFTGTRKPQSRNEEQLQRAAKSHVESLDRSVIVVQWDHDGNPDHLYLIPRDGLWFAVAVEFKDLGKKPEKHQAKKILGLLGKMPVAVISDIKTFKIWFNKVVIA